MRSTHHRIEVLETKLAMIADDGASPRGTLPAREYFDAAEQTNPGERDRLEELRQAHQEGRGPPDWAAQQDNPGNGGGN